MQNCVFPPLPTRPQLTAVYLALLYYRIDGPMYERIAKASFFFYLGKALELNKELSNMDFSHMYSRHHFLLWNMMCEHFGAKAHYETLESFFKQNFLFCFSLGRNPRIGKNIGMTKDPADRRMGFVEAGTLEVSIMCPFVGPSVHLLRLICIYVDYFGHVLY